MGFIFTIKATVKNLLARKGRTFLTMLGIIIGVAGVIIIISLGAGAQSLVLGQVNKLGTNLLSIQPGKSDTNGPPAQVYGIIITTLVEEDAQALRAQLPHALAVNALVRGIGSVTWQNKTVDTNFLGTDSSYPDVVDFTMNSGAFMNEAEANSGANVVVLGKTVADSLFNGTGVDPIGQVIKVRVNSADTKNQSLGVPLRVVGVVNKRGSAFFQDQDDQIYVPLSIGQNQLLGIHYLQVINLKVDNADNIDQTIEDATRVLKQRHHILTDENIDFTVRNQATAIGLLTTITDALSLFLTSMAAISLIVGGIGILNIMLVTVAERTREIGLRKAVGAKNGDIMKQFLLESGILTALGGIIGIVVGVVLSYLMAVLMKFLGFDWDFVISLWSVVLAVSVSILTGVVFGLYPSYKASKLDPIEALRYE
ncbi:MAG: putative ABC transport system permease protein [Parcubacteria bacterium C7867-006]|nr:MAG: putative ABC transport system permease protein [Parcubacteria bacterium C7867-006]